MSPRLVELPKELEEIRDECLQYREGSEAFQEAYWTRFFPRFAPLFSQLPLHNAPDGMTRPKALVSVVGFSQAPVALMASWCQAKQILMLVTDESRAYSPMDRVARAAKLPMEAITIRRVDDGSESGIYRAVKEFCDTSGIPPQEIAIDATGGKKSMSAAAYLAGFLWGMRLVYVDYGRYDPQQRKPVIGTEYPRLLENPLDVLGDLAYRDIYSAFNRGDFLEAQHLAASEADRLYEPRRAQYLAKLAEGYGAWDAYRFGEALSALNHARDMFRAFSRQFPEISATPIPSDDNLRAIEKLAHLASDRETVQDALPLLGWYLSKAERLLNNGHTSLAVLLTYAVVERYIGVCLWEELEVNVDDPDAQRIPEKLDAVTYQEARSMLTGKRDSNAAAMQDIASLQHIQFVDGVALLIGCHSTHLSMNDVRWMKGLATARNQCEYEHGFLPKIPASEHAARFLNKARDMIGRSGLESELQAAIQICAFPVLGR